VGSLGSFARDVHPEMSDKLYYVNFSSDKTVNSDVSPYGTFHLGVTVYVTNNGIEQSWTYRIPDKTITRVPEQDYDIDAIKGAGWSYDKSKSDLELLTELVSSDDVVYQDGTNYGYNQNFNYLNQLFDGISADGNLEAVSIIVQDTRGKPGEYNAGSLILKLESGFSESFSTSSERTVEKWKQFYEVQNQN